MNTDKQIRFSPRTRGCSVDCGVHPDWGYVFPAHAGMFLFIEYEDQASQGFPRARGDVPLRKLIHYVHGVFSPRTRGCSSGRCIAGVRLSVFPAHAGMFPPTIYGTLA